MSARVDFQIVFVNFVAFLFYNRRIQTIGLPDQNRRTKEFLRRDKDFFLTEYRYRARCVVVIVQSRGGQHFAALSFNENFAASLRVLHWAHHGRRDNTARRAGFITGGHWDLRCDHQGWLRSKQDLCRESDCLRV